MVETCLRRASRSFTVHGRDPAFDFEARNGVLNFATGGAAVKMLDIDTRQALVEAIGAFEGAVVIVSHDPRIESFANRIINIEDGRIGTEKPSNERKAPVS